MTPAGPSRNCEMWIAGWIDCAQNVHFFTSYTQETCPGRAKPDCPGGAIRLKLPLVRESVGFGPLAEIRARHGPPPSDVPRGHIGRRAPCRWCRQVPANPRDRFSAAES